MSLIEQPDEKDFIEELIQLGIEMSEAECPENIQDLGHESPVISQSPVKSEDNSELKKEKNKVNTLKLIFLIFLSGGIITGIVFLSIFLYKKFKSKDKKSVK